MTTTHEPQTCKRRSPDSTFVTPLEGGGLRVSASPRFVPGAAVEGSDAKVFVYKIALRNESAVPVRVLRRTWLIADDTGLSRIVEGEGLVGEQPRIEPGDSHVYESFCPLEADWGTMEGSFSCELDDGTAFEARVDRFFLIVPEAYR